MKHIELTAENVALFVQVYVPQNVRARACVCVCVGISVRRTKTVFIIMKLLIGLYIGLYWASSHYAVNISRSHFVVQFRHLTIIQDKFRSA